MKELRESQRPMLVLAEGRMKDPAVTLSVVIVQIFHERINKLWKIKKDHCHSEEKMVSHTSPLSICVCVCVCLMTCRILVP